MTPNAKGSQDGRALSALEVHANFGTWEDWGFGRSMYMRTENKSYH